MIMLTSDGLSSEKILDILKERKKYIPFSTAVIITTASFPYKEKDYHIPRITAELESLGLTVDYFDFDTDKPEKLLDYDVVEINGGNPFYLLKAIKTAKAEEILKKISMEKILIGISAGALVLQRNIDFIASLTPEMNDEVGLTDLTGVDLISYFEIFPHYSRYLNRFEGLEDKIKEHEKANNCEVYRRDDGEAVIFTYPEELERINNILDEMEMNETNMTD